VSTIAEERSALGGRTGAERFSLDRLLAWRPVLTPEVIAYGVILLVAFGLRFWNLADRAMHHDESLHATYSWYLFDGKGYEHHPLMHGPLLFHLMALGYLLFGVSEATSRIVPAAFGVALVLLPVLLRPWLGRAGALAASAMIAISPSLLYFSRFVGAGAQDILVLAGMLLMVAGIWHYLRSGHEKWMYLTAAGLMVGFTTKEVTYMLAAMLVLYLNGAAAAAFASQTAPGLEEGEEAVDEPPLRVRLRAVAYMPIAWFLVLFWPFIGGLRERLRLRELPRAGELLIVIGTLSAPMFSAASQVLLERLGVDMARPAPIGDWTNEQLWGAITIGGLMALSVYFGTAWNARRWLISAGIFWGASVTLFTTFFTNPDGVATGIWGSLDYWLEQQHVLRGNQPVFYYVLLSPVYEFLPLTLMLAGVVYTAVKTGWDTTVAAVLTLVLCIAGAVLGDGAHMTLPFVVPALLTAVYAVRERPFQQFLVFWFGAILIGLSSAGEKMPWLETHVAMPMILLAAFTVQDAVRSAGRVEMPRWALPAGALLATGAIGALLAVLSDRVAWANSLLGLVLVAGLVAVGVLTARRHPAAGLAGAALVVGIAGPLTVRAAGIAAYKYGDIPKELLVYTQSTPELEAVRDQIDAYARQSGRGKNLPIIVDSTEAFTWPWAWYLRDYKNVSYPDLGGYRGNPQLQQTLPADGVLLTELRNSDIGVAMADRYGPGHRFKHRAWFPEEDYRILTTDKFLRWVRDPDVWKLWGKFFLHRETVAPIGSIDGVAYFPPTWDLSGNLGAAKAAPEPRVEPDGRIVAGEFGLGTGQFQRPAGMAVDREGNVYVADSLNHRIQKLGPDGRYLATLGGGASRMFQEPWGVAVDASGNIYVADTWNHRIQKFDRDMKPLLSWGGPPRAPGQAPSSPLELCGPRAIAIDAAGNLLVTDTGHARIVKFSPEGQPLGTLGTAGTGQGQFQEPVGIAIAPNGDALVTDAWNGRVQRFDSNLAYKSEFKVDGWADRGVENKPYIAAAADGTVYVTVPDTGRVLRFDDQGKQINSRVALSEGGIAARPLGIAATADGGVWVADGASARVLKLPAPTN
jgi:uncharacterized protein (TIGR03663 family)